MYFFPNSLVYINYYYFFFYLFYVNLSSQYSYTNVCLRKIGLLFKSISRVQSNVVQGLLPRPLPALFLGSMDLLLLPVLKLYWLPPGFPLIFDCDWSSFKLNLSKPYWRSSSTSSSDLLPVAIAAGGIFG